MKVSVVIPTYYRPKDLSELFDSLLKQTFKPLEVIIVDDTPSNIIEEVCVKYRDKFLRFNVELVYVKNYRERSAAIARNIGVSIAAGDVILFLDSDIILCPDYIEKVIDVFKNFPHALGVQGHIVNIGMKGEGNTFYLLKYYLINAIRKIFFLSHFRHFCKKSVGLFEYPIIIPKIINCVSLSGSNMSFRREIFNYFKFDESLKGYSYMEDLLLSHSIHKKYPNSLYITPYAKCIHKVSREGRTEMSLFESSHMHKCRKYVLTKLFGAKGLFIFFWQTAGLLLFSIIRKVWSFIRK